MKPVLWGRVGTTFGLATLLLMFFCFPPETALAQEKGGTGLSGQCAACHEGVVKSFAATRHGKADTYKAWGFAESCVSCHEGAAAHAESADPSKVVNPGRLKGAVATESCLKCHGNQHTQAFWQGSGHETSDVNCLSCHSIHKPRATEHLLVKASANETCLACHTDLRKAQFQRSTHLFRDENRSARMSCTDCHSPHGSQAPKMVKANSANELCFTCHTEKRGPFLWQHSPAQENCMTCHSPHGSNNPSLLAKRTTQLCQSCHMQGRHQTVAGSPNTMWNINRSCLTCHPQVHGSNHPSGVNLQR